ncbi:hypothetical protein [Neotamlana laminarinivorans]|uniref:Uncharacterized protein n=1 Tax=Neotamlana laminarinivorans TaxID=2883124 RepID=A0A9X1L2J6_9FLAO|nr:hypothetical protein [Tamlana laminarinivorans]MCB4799843.1 hypothetical protein [Tamlana laminarinivorans]
MHKLFLIICFLTVTLPSNKNTTNNIDPEFILRSKIASLLSVPDIHFKKDTKVTIKFELNEKNKINVQYVLPKDEKIVKYVNTRLNNKKLKTSLDRRIFTVSILLKKTEDNW